VIPEIEVGEDCLCPMDENTNVTAFSRHCPEHGHLASKATTIHRPWCSGSSEPVDILSKRTGRCRVCRLEVPQKYGFTAVHLDDGSTPRE
jgi:hypothetical protein